MPGQCGIRVEAASDPADRCGDGTESTVSPDFSPQGERPWYNVSAKAVHIAEETWLRPCLFCFFRYRRGGKVREERVPEEKIVRRPS